MHVYTLHRRGSPPLRGWLPAVHHLLMVYHLEGCDGVGGEGDYPCVQVVISPSTTTP